MPDREKVVTGLIELKRFLPSTMWEPINDALAMLKEQEDLGTELTNAVELIHKKNERIEKLLKEQKTSNLYKCPNCGTWVSAENVVRCKDCIWYDQRDGICEHHAVINNPSPNWFCADGICKEGR